MKLLLSAGVIVLCLLAMLATINGQSVTGQISGTVTDPAGAVMVGVRVQLTHDVSQQVRDFTTEANGSFVFTGLVPGSYSLHIAQTGFRAYDEKAIIVAAQERVDLHNVRLSIGDINQTVEVSAQTVHVATDSSDRSVAVNLLQIEDTPIRGRDFLATIKALPGVQDLSAHDARGWGVAMPTINGGQMGQTQLNIDGIAAQDSGNLNPGYMAPSVDAIAEVRLVVSNFTAEYGGRTGGTMQVSIKGGSNQYHGSAYYYWRHEQFNANEFFNNAQRITKPRSYPVPTSTRAALSWSSFSRWIPSATNPSLRTALPCPQRWSVPAISRKPSPAPALSSPSLIRAPGSNIRETSSPSRPSVPRGWRS